MAAGGGVAGRRRLLHVVEQILFGERDVLHLEAEFRGDEHGGVEVDGLVDRDHHAHREQLLDDLAGLDGHLVRELGDRAVLGVGLHGELDVVAEAARFGTFGAYGHHFGVDVADPGLCRGI